MIGGLKRRFEALFRHSQSAQLHLTSPTVLLTFIIHTSHIYAYVDRLQFLILYYGSALSYHHILLLYLSFLSPFYLLSISYKYQSSYQIVCKSASRRLQVQILLQRFLILHLAFITSTRTAILLSILSLSIISLSHSRPRPRGTTTH